MSSAATLLPAVSFAHLFRSPDSGRDKFLARLFGIFYEQIVRIWASCDWAPFQDLGRPTLRREGDRRGSTLDFALRSRRDGRVFAGEMKCVLEYDNYKYLTLTDHSQLASFKNEAFLRFLALARDLRSYKVFVNGHEVEVSGAVLIWGSATNAGKEKVKASTGLHDILALEDIIDDLLAHDVLAYTEFLDQRAAWCTEMFGFLAGRDRPLKGITL